MGGGVASAMATFRTIMIGILATFVVLGVVGFMWYKKNQKKKFNIPLIIITPRSDCKVVEINRGVGGFFKSQKVGGITSFRVKRKGIAVVDIPPPASSFLSSPDRTLILAQKGVDDYEPVMPESLAYVSTLEKTKDKDGNEIDVVVPILQLRAINQAGTAWHCDNQESAKRRFTFASLWEKYQVLITLMTFIFILFLILYIQWIGMKDVVSGLQEVANSLKSTTAPIITPAG